MVGHLIMKKECAFSPVEVTHEDKQERVEQGSLSHLQVRIYQNTLTNWVTFFFFFLNFFTKRKKLGHLCQHGRRRESNFSSCHLSLNISRSQLCLQSSITELFLFIRGNICTAAPVRASVLKVEPRFTFSPGEEQSCDHHLLFCL